MSDIEFAKFGDDCSESCFSERTIRLGFIRKVYAILSCQLLVTVSFILLFLFWDKANMFAHKHYEFTLAFGISTIVIIIILGCCPNVRRSTPTNYICLLIFTILESLFVAGISALYAISDVLIAMGIVTVISFALTIFSLQTKWDFTLLGGFLYVTLLIFVLFGLLCAILLPLRVQYNGVDISVVRIVYSSLGALIFALYLVYDTQLMLGGKHKYALSPEEYIFAALNLYLDIINMFLYILAIFGSSK